MIRKLNVSDIVESKCTRCRRVTNHTIVAMVEGRVVRVQCNTCSGIHNYYSPQAEAETKSSSTKTRTSSRPAGPASAKKSANAAETWEKMISDKDPDLAAAYDPAGKFKVNTLIKHAVFGTGAVTAVRGNKMEVVFREGIKTLRCG